MNRARAPERWLVVEVSSPEDPEISGLLIEELATIGVGGVEETRDVLRIYVPAAEEDRDELLERVESIVSAHGAGGPTGCTYSWQAHEDWSELWRQGLEPRRVTSRLVVTPTWKEPDSRPGDLVITLDPGMAFGTAEHPTTRGCLRLLDRWVEAGQRIADIGAGSGILSIAAVLLGADRVLAVEMDAWSCTIARENAEANGVADRIEVRELRIGPEFLPDRPPFDGIVSNIESGVLDPLLPGFRSGLVEGGWLILSGILDSESADILRDARAAGFRLEAEDTEDQWWSGAFRDEGSSGDPDG